MKSRKILIIEDPQVKSSNVMSSAVNTLSMELAAGNFIITRAASYAEAMPLVMTDMDIDTILMAVDIVEDPAEDGAEKALLDQIRRWQHNVPLFMLADRENSVKNISAELMMNSSLEFIWILEDSPVFIAGRITAAAERFRARLLPPLMQAIWQYNESNHEYSWAAPGHQGGRGFVKSQSGKKFYDFYGENLFRTDTGIERSSIGSLLDHTGAFGESEKFAAEIFGADISFSGIVGTSGSNRSIMQAVLSEGDLAICDRNCHKSIEQGLINTGAVPIYLKPSRNRFGIIGPVLPEEINEHAIAEKISASPLEITGGKRSYCVLTNCTYDGICCNAAKIEYELDKSTDLIHFDEAWYAYARFNPIYQNHFAMRKNAEKHDRPTVFATHSTHKLLAALSQASYIHMRKGRKDISFDQLNQGYMLNSSTSPLYAICASNDIAVKMMADNGTALTGQVIEEAVDFRQAIAKIERDFSRKNSWFFKAWNPSEVTDPASGKKYDFADAPAKLLVNEQSCWQLRPGESWHGFEKLTDNNWAMLDPVKVSILAPGMGDDGKISSSGVPAALVSKFIYDAGIVPTRTTDFQLMFLFSIGITKGKWMTLLNSLLRFKELYDSNAPVEEVLSGLADEYKARYRNCGIRDIGDKMLDHLRRFTPDAKLNAAFESLPEQAMTPRQAYMEMVRGNTELIPADKLINRIAANSLIPYPPGIPMVISGERFGEKGNPHMEYLRSLTEWDAEFPGFEHVTEGVSVINGIYHVNCIKN